jgi:hypothetical protein
MDIKLNPGHPGIAPIWPPPRNALTWPPGPTLDELGMAAIGRAAVTVDVAPVSIS